MSIEKQKKIQTACYGILIALLIIYFFTLFYTDIQITYYHSLTFLDCLFDGKPWAFYNATVADLCRGLPANYYLPMYIIFAIWNIPLWLLSRFGNVAPFSVGCLLWLKGLVVVFILGCCHFIRKILQLLDNKDVNFALFLFISSMLVVIPAIAVAQYDIISTFFVLWGIFRGAKEDRLSVKTVLIFSIAVPLKFFSLATFGIFLLLKEKRIIHIVKYLAIGMLGTVLSIVLSLHDAGFHSATKYFNNMMLNRLFDISIDGGISKIPLFFACTFVVCIIAYAWKPTGAKDLLWRMFWLGMFFYLSFFAFVPAYPYWVILLAPFAVLLAVQNSKNAKLSLILELVMEISIIAAQAITFSWVYLSSNAFALLLMKHVPVASDLLGISNFADLANKISNKFSFIQPLPLLFTLFAVAGGSLLWVSFPPTHPEEKQIEGGNPEIKPEIKTGVYCIRTLCLLGYFVLSVAIVYFI